MKFTQIVVLLSSSITLAQPFGGKPNQPDASDGYPSPTKDQLREISWRADGTLSNAPLPAKLAYFSSFLCNVTNNIHGYKSHYRYSKSELVKMLTTVVAQEELHAINAINVLKHFQVPASLPCKYHFPATYYYQARH
ncbi:hypothetical protein HZ326_2324 [Fusarium oxysporum f. sp. albedinis]|nr:hypothetical protein HZ326_2324 [Fusarium oxysporum f. sp. albedinis]